MPDSESFAFLVSLTAALFVGGMPVLAGATYLVATGTLSILTLFIISVATTLIWDTAWYFLGRLMPLEKIRAFPILKGAGRLWDKALHLYGKQQYLVLFASRFAYGTNNVVVIVSGMHRMGYPAFISISFASITIWFFVLIFLSRYFHHYIGTESYPFSLAIAVVCLIAAAMAARYGIKRIIDRYLLS